MSMESRYHSSKRSSRPESILLAPVIESPKRISKIDDIEFFQPPAYNTKRTSKLSDIDFFQSPVEDTKSEKTEDGPYAGRHLSKTPIEGVDVTVVEVQPVVPPQPPSFPEGGFWGWMTLFGSTMGQFAGFGYTNAFGVYQDFYVRDFLSDYSPSVISWIGGAQIFLIFSSGIIVGRLFDKGYYYHMMVLGALLGGFSLFMLSLCQKNHFYQVFLCHGIGWGLSGGLIYLPTLSVLSHYFNQRRPLAMGIASAGSALGATVHPIIVNNLIHGPLGFHNGVRVSAGITFGCLVLAVVCSRTRLPPKKGIKAIPVGDFIRDTPYMFVLLAAILVFCGLFFPTFFIQLYAVTHGVNETLSFYSISILNGASILGRLIPGFLAPKFGVFNLMTFFATSAGIVILTMVAVQDLVGTVLFAAFVGFFTGASVSLFAPLLGALARDLSEIGIRIGMVSAIAGILGLFASPIAGALLTDEFIWLHAVLFSGITYVAGGVCYGIARWFVARRKGVSIV